MAVSGLAALAVAKKAFADEGGGIVCRTVAPDEPFGSWDCQQVLICPIFLQTCKWVETTPGNYVCKCGW